MNTISMSGTRFAALMMLARPSNETDKVVEATIADKVTVEVPASHPGGGTIADMRKAAGWSEGAAAGTIPVYRSFGIQVTMTKDADGTKRYRAVWDKNLQIVDTGRGQWKNGTRPTRASDVASLPGNPGNAAIDQAVKAATEAAAEAVEEAVEKIEEVAKEAIAEAVETIVEIHESVAESEGQDAAVEAAMATKNDEPEVAVQAVDPAIAAKVIEKRRHRGQEDKRAAK